MNSYKEESRLSELTDPREWQGSAALVGRADRSRRYWQRLARLPQGRD